jgi:endoglucanase
MKINKLNTDLLSQICFEPGAPGFEQPIRKLVLKELKGLVDELTVDNMGNILTVKKGASRKKLMIAAHLDELGFIVHHIDENGFIRFYPLGGYDPKTLSAQRVLIHGKNEVKGVMGTKPVHKMTSAERTKAPKISDFFIDTGMTKDAVEKLVKPGDSVTRRGDLEIMGDCVCAKSLDNRVGVFILIEVLKTLKKTKLPWDLHAVFTVQEEVGLRGAKVVAHKLAPEVGIGLDTTVAYDTPGAPAQDRGTALGEGAGIKALDSGSIGDRRLIDFLKSVATINKIKYQIGVVPGGSNDTAAIQSMVPGGSITGSICIPTRHIHQSVEMCHTQDIIDTIALVKATMLSIDKLKTNHV